MFSASVEIGIILSLAMYFLIVRVNFRRRQRCAWDRLAAQLQVKSLGPESSFQLYRSPNQLATPCEKWQAHQGAFGLWSMYENARIMLDLANYASENSTTIDPELLANLRSDAMHIRVYVLLALSKYACSQVNESTCENVARAAAIYHSMEQKMTELMQASGEVLVPQLACQV